LFANYPAIYFNRHSEASALPHPCCYFNGPFVNTYAEIHQALENFRAGRFWIPVSMSA